MSRDHDYSSGDVFSGSGCGILGILALAVVGIAIAFACTSYQRVDPGNVGVLIDFGQGTTQGRPVIENVPTGQWKWINPITQRLVEYPVAQQTLSMVRTPEDDDSVVCQDRDSISLAVDSRTLWRVDPDHAGDLYLLRPGIPLSGEEGGDISSLIVRAEVRSALGIVCGRFKWDEIAGPKRAEVEQAVEPILADRLARSFIILDQFNLGEPHPNEEQQAALQRKAEAEQAALTARFLAQKAEEEKKAAIVKAEADAAVRIAQAEAEKQARILQAEGESEAIRKINQAINENPRYVEYLIASKYNGDVPQTVIGGGDGTPSIIGILPTGNPSR